MYVYFDRVCDSNDLQNNSKTMASQKWMISNYIIMMVNHIDCLIKLKIENWKVCKGTEYQSSVTSVLHLIV